MIFPIHYKVLNFNSYSFFLFLASRNDFQRALQLFEQLKREVVEPDPEIIKLLQNLLKKNNQSMPLSLMSSATSEISTSAIEATILKG